MTIATISEPQPGLWQVEVDGEGTFAFTAHVKGARDDLNQARAAFFRLDGTQIKPADATTPDVPYRKGVIGTDAQGHVFQRMERALIEP